MHKHAKLMMEYAQDAMETDTPWKHWEVYNPQYNEWEILRSNPFWASDLEYRRKQKTIQVEIPWFPPPVREPLQYGDEYWFTNAMHAIRNFWDGTSVDKYRLEQGEIHRTKEAAEQHLAALKYLNNIQR